MHVNSPENDNARAYVIHNFVPESPCELYLKKGDIITEVEVLKDGWCKVSAISRIIVQRDSSVSLLG